MGEQSRWGQGHSTEKASRIRAAAARAIQLETLELRQMLAGDGLRGAYFPNIYLSGTPVNRVDAKIDFNFQGKPPIMGTGNEDFSVRWTGLIQPEFSETYTFSTRTDDGVRLWVNGQKLIDNWTLHAETKDSGSIALMAGQQYQIKLEYFQKNGGAIASLLWSSPSQPEQVIPTSRLFSLDTTTVIALPNTPSGTRLLEMTETEMQIAWNSNGGGQSGFAIDRSTDAANWTQIGSVGAAVTTFVSTGLNPQTQYYFRVRAFNASGSSPAGNIVVGTTLALPASGGDGLWGAYFPRMDLTGTAVNRLDPSVNFNWGGGSPISGIGSSEFSARWTGQIEPTKSETYTFYTTSDDGVRLWVNGQQIINNWTDHASVEDRGSMTLQAGVKYSIRLEYYQKGGGDLVSLSWSSPTTPKQIIPQTQLYSAGASEELPGAPGSVLLSSITSSSMVLSWVDSTPGRTSSFVIERSSDGVSFTQVATAQAFETVHVATGLSPSTTYHYRVRALGVFGGSTPSGAVSAATLGTVPPAPGSMQATTVSQTEIRLNWEDVQGEALYVVMMSKDGTNFLPLRTVSSGVTSLLVSGLLANTAYSFYVRAANAQGFSTPTATVGATTQPQVEVRPPATVSASATGSSSIKLSWSGVFGAAGYTIARSTDGANYSTLASVGGATTVYTDQSLATGAKYHYLVRADFEQGSSGFSAAASATTLSADISSSHPTPKYTGTFNFNHFPNLVTPVSGRPNHLFYEGDSVVFQLGGASKTYEVRDYWGNLVDSGNAAASVKINVTQPGWYKLYVFGTQPNADFGDVVGGTTFSIFRNDPNLPTHDAAKFTDLKLTRIDETIDFAWNGNPPVAGLKADNFAVEWTGQIVPIYNEEYTFYTNSDDGMRLWIDGRLVIDDWAFHGARETPGKITLTANKAYSIKVQYYQNTYGAVAQLFWSSPSQAKQIVPKTVLYSDSQQIKPNGLTAKYYSLLTDTNNTEDQVLRAVTGMGPQRHYVLDANDPAKSIAALENQIRIDELLYLPGDPVRDREIMVAFSSGTSNIAGVKQIVERFKNVVKYWEPRNEPNDDTSGDKFAINEMKPFYETIKSVDPNLQVIGPGTVSIDRNLQGYLDAFFTAGGGKYIDAFSFHAYNVVNGDVALARQQLEKLQATLKKYNLQNIPLWQTEQGYPAADNGAYRPRLQGRWTMTQMMVFEQYGIPKERNVLYYDRSHGNWGYPVFWENDDGSLNPAVTLMRVWSEQLYGTKFSKAYNFGSSNNIYLGSLFTGPNKSVAAFMSAGDTRGKVTLTVNGGSTLKIVSSFGQSQTVPVVNGRVTIDVPEVPVYVEMSNGQTIDVVPDSWGTNLASASGTTVTTTAAPDVAATANRIVNGKLESWYWDGQVGYEDKSVTLPATVTINLPQAQSVSRMVVYSNIAWGQGGTLLDYDIQYEKDGQWITLDSVHVDPATFGVFSPTTRTTVDSYSSDQWIFQHQFAPVTTSKMRILVKKVTYGGGATPIVSQAGGQAAATPSLQLREVELFAQ